MIKFCWTLKRGMITEEKEEYDAQDFEEGEAKKEFDDHDYIMHGTIYQIKELENE